MKQKTIFASILLSLLFFSACEIITYDEIAIKPYNGTLEWSMITKNAEWSNRYDLAAVAFDQKLWVMGGYNPGGLSGDSYNEDVWNSSDGENWDLITDDAPWKGRRGHKIVVFNDGSGDAMFLIGGFSVNESNGYRQYNNDVWKSTDGENWNLIKECTYPALDNDSTWFPRMSHSCVTVNHQGIDYIYLIGGKTMLEDHAGAFSMEYFNDVWRSTDGVDWVRLITNDYGIRAEHATTVNPINGKIYVQGGYYGTKINTIDNSTQPLPDWNWLWTSTDGTNWLAENDTENFDQDLLNRSAHQMVFYKNTVWAFSGKSVSSVHYGFVKPDYYASWTYDESQQMQVDSYGSDMDARHGYAAVIFKDKIWIMGGNTNKNGQSNDVWCAE